MYTKYEFLKCVFSPTTHIVVLIDFWISKSTPLQRHQPHIFIYQTIINAHWPTFDGITQTMFTGRLAIDNMGQTALLREHYGTFGTFVSLASNPNAVTYAISGNTTPTTTTQMIPKLFAVCRVTTAMNFSFVSLNHLRRHSMMRREIRCAAHHRICATKFIYNNNMRVNVGWCVWGIRSDTHSIGL